MYAPGTLPRRSVATACMSTSPTADPTRGAGPWLDLISIERGGSHLQWLNPPLPLSILFCFLWRARFLYCVVENLAKRF